ncbi:hypothetical protein COS52_03450 [Candidatus Roizmanbacteria bacterium CG03_land_8_20_14_0_80_39_12]|uniref:Peptidase S1 domain-containing protein n=1 Tax=Candidatus Roizmanbacteria bacterium CG03_land_8_20_14_0_80_39_12 TaxID=1974847 RepID=A0A2M7BS49_9BACT|nr:MAG: hypothetical protein COS52_03450 [Candidatus Roizmanbacteria bacterium CG03_land_8_20_14_0_80_39_12]
MSKKICINKKNVLILLLIALFISIMTFSSSYLLGKKTTYQSKAAPPQNNPKIYGGTEVTDLTKWPFIVRLFEIHDFLGKKFGSPSSSGYCDGTIVAKQWVLTAAHCVIKRKTSNIGIYIGSIDLHGANGNAQTIYINDILIHPYYNADKNENDIALIKLSKEIDLPIEPVSLNSDITKERDGQVGVIIGWGLIEDEARTSILRQGIIPILDKSRTLKWDQRYLNSIFSSTIVAGYPNGGAGICNGDSGGPLLVWSGMRWLQVGVVSGTTYGSYYKGEPTCGAKHKPGIFTRISYIGTDTQNNAVNYMRWITENIGERTDYFIGTQLTPTEKTEYYNRICDPQEWDNKLPPVCTLNIYHGP